MSVESPDGGAGHPLSPMLRSVVIVNHNGVTNDGGLATQRKVGVSEELLGGAQVQDLASHVELPELGGQVTHPASERRLVRLAVLVNSETGHRVSYSCCQAGKFQEKLPISGEMQLKIQTLNARFHSPC